MTAEIISVGTELLLGNILNTNAQFLSRELAELGITVQRQSTIGDNQTTTTAWPSGSRRPRPGPTCWSLPGGWAPPPTT